LAGRTVTIHFRDGAIPPATGKVIAVEPAKGEGAWNRTYQQPNYYGNYGYTFPVQPQGRFLILEKAEKRVYVDSGMIAYASVSGGGDTVMERRSVLELTVKKKDKTTPAVHLSYLAKGLAWAPSYRVDITDPKRLSIAQKAVIKNEMEDLEDAELYLISGYPSIQFSHVTSPLSLRTTWTAFFQQLSQDPQSGHHSMGQFAMTQNAAYNYAAPPSGNTGGPTMPAGEGPDIHYQPVGKRTLNEGDSLLFSVASAEADYERIVEWIVPDTRRADGRYLSEHERRRKPEEYRDAAWDALRFKNPLPFPMTTGAAMITGKDRFQGQRMTYWVNKGEQTTLHITKALSLRTRHVEHEEKGEREIVYVGGDDYNKTVVKGELLIDNHRNETVPVVIRRRFSGELLEADGDPHSVLREEGVWSVNKRNELTWSIILKPGAEQKLTYRYSVLVNR
ncbi:MAG: hypothetical protein AAF492_20405, partial [Verrucomicrobiota bacterium]